LRSLVADVGAHSDVMIGFTAPASIPPLSKEAELALFRSLQEALSNVRRHAAARSVEVTLALDPERLERDGHMGLAGMRERIGALGGSVRFGGGRGAGTALEVLLPVVPAQVP